MDKIVACVEREDNAFRSRLAAHVASHVLPQMELQPGTGIYQGLEQAVCRHVESQLGALAMFKVRDHEQAGVRCGGKLGHALMAPGHTRGDIDGPGP